MASIGKMTFNGKSGAAYRFKIFPLGTRFRKLSEVYVVDHRTHGADGSRRLLPVFVGNTDDLSQPLDHHRKAKAPIASAYYPTLSKNPA